MKDRVVLRYVLAVIAMMLTFAAVIWLTSCGGDSVSSPSPDVAATPTTGPGTTGGTTATPAPTVASTPDPSADLSYVTLNIDGSGTFCALPVGGRHAYVTYTPPMVVTPIYGHYLATAEVNTCVAIPKARDVIDPLTGQPILFPWCGPKEVQVDVNQSGYQAGRHMGHIFASIPGNDPSCDPCIPKWVELPPEVTHTEWGECHAADAPAETCEQHRDETTIIREQNSCTGEIREKSRETHQETQPCRCDCVPSWIELPPVITYTEWSECAPIPGGCGQQREKRTVIEEENSCTHERRIKSDLTEVEVRSCECPTCVVGTGNSSFCIPVLSGEAEELEWLNGLGIGGPFTVIGKIDTGGADSWVAPQDYAIVIAKDGSCTPPVAATSVVGGIEYRVFRNVHAGDVISMQSGKGVSHVTLFGCVQ